MKKYKNNRSIEFRVWDIIEKSFIDNGKGLSFIDLAEYECENSSLKKPEFIFQQFTGRLDTNGKKIFEGDIIIEADDNHKNPSKAIIVFENAAFNADFNYFNDDFDMVGIVGNLGTLKVIGNIFENPKLLTK